MSLAILSDGVIAALLDNLTREEVESFQDELKTALHEYSTGTQSVATSLYNQPARTSTYSEQTGATTMYMPSCSPAGNAVKVVTVSSPHGNPSLPTIRPTGSLTLYSPEGNPVGFLHAQTLTAFRTALASSCLLTKRATVRTITVFGSGLQAYWHIRLALLLRGSTIRTVNIINRQFSDNARSILKKFYAVPLEVKEREGWDQAQFSLLTPGYGEYERLRKEHIRDADVIYCCTPSTTALFDAGILTSREGRKKGRLVVAIGSYSKDMRELPRDLLTQATKTHEKGHLHYHKHATEGGVIVVDSLDGALGEAGELIDAELGPKQLVELGELIMIRRLAIEEDISSQQSTADTDSVTDSFDKLDMGSTASAISSSKRSSSHSPSRTNSSGGTADSSSGGFLSSLPSILNPHHHHHHNNNNNDTKNNHSHEHKHKHKHSTSHADGDKKRNDHLARWLTSGNVIYKSVGLGLMDLVVGFRLVEMANAKSVGDRVEDFSPKPASA